MGAPWAPMGAHGGPREPMGRIIIALYNTCQLATPHIGFYKDFFVLKVNFFDFLDFSGAVWIFLERLKIL